MNWRWKRYFPTALKAASLFFTVEVAATRLFPYWRIFRNADFHAAYNKLVMDVADALLPATSSMPVLKSLSTDALFLLLIWILGIGYSILIVSLNHSLLVNLMEARIEVIEEKRKAINNPPAFDGDAVLKKYRSNLFWSSIRESLACVIAWPMMLIAAFIIAILAIARRRFHLWFGFRKMSDNAQMQAIYEAQMSVGLLTDSLKGWSLLWSFLIAGAAILAAILLGTYFA